MTCVTHSSSRVNMLNLFHPELHPIFEAAGFTAGFAVYRHERKRRGDFLSEDRHWAVIAAAATGALVGSKLLGSLRAPLEGTSIGKTCLLWVERPSSADCLADGWRW